MVCSIKVVILISCVLHHVCTVQHFLKGSAHCYSQTFPFDCVASFVLGATSSSSSEKHRRDCLQ